jgi:hypothetical protein
MLFTDADFISSADLTSIDPEVVDISRAEKIVLDSSLGAASGINAQACDEVGQRLLQETQAFSGFMPPFAMPYNQTAAVLNLVGPTVNRSRISLSQIVVSGVNPTELSSAKMSALKRYAVYEALVMFYRAAYYRKTTDRYEKRMQLYENEVRRKHWPRFFNQGVPVVYKPLAAPGAIHEYNAGVWNSTNVATVVGVNILTAATYDVAITWVDDTKYVSPTSKGNAESSVSARITGPVATSNVLQVSIAGLNAPNGLAPLNVSLGQGLVIPGTASGWNVYCGSQGATLYLQNSTPIDIATKTYTFAGAPVLTGFPADSGQYPDAHFTLQKTLMRG